MLLTRTVRTSPMRSVTWYSCDADHTACCCVPRMRSGGSHPRCFGPSDFAGNDGGAVDRRGVGHTLSTTAAVNLCRRPRS